MAHWNDIVEVPRYNREFVYSKSMEITRPRSGPACASNKIPANMCPELYELSLIDLARDGKINWFLITTRAK